MSATTQREPGNTRRKMIDRNSGQSLTSEEVLKKLEEKEKNKQTKRRVASNKTSTENPPKKR